MMILTFLLMACGGGNGGGPDESISINSGINPNRAISSLSSQEGCELVIATTAAQVEYQSEVNSCQTAGHIAGYDEDETG